MSNIITDGLIAYYNSKHGVSGSTWENISPNTKGQYNGTINGAIIQTDGMYFDGIDDRVNITEKYQEMSSNTLEYWIKPQTTSGIRNHCGTDQRTLWSRQNNGALNYNSWSITPAYYITTSLTHILITNSSSTRSRLYVNGVYKGQANTNSNIVGLFSIGNIREGSSSFFQGHISSLRIYDKVLTDAEITQNYAVGTEIGLPEQEPPQIITDNLIGYWHYKQGVVGNTWENISPNTVGSYNGAITNATLQANGVFINSGGYISISSFPSSSNFTYEIGILTPPTLNSVFGILGNTSRGINLDSFSGMLRYYWNGTHSKLSGDLKGNIDYIVTISKNGTSLSGYINGAKTGEVTVSVPSIDGTIEIGRYLGGNSNFRNGVIKFVRMYNSTLSDTEIAQNYAVGSEVGLSQTPASSPPKVTVIDTSRQKISPIPPNDKSSLKFKFDQDVTDWAVMVLGADYSSGTMAGNGKNVSANTEISVDITYRMLSQEGQNRINIYGRNSDGIWTPYE